MELFIEKKNVHFASKKLLIFTSGVFIQKRTWMTVTIIPLDVQLSVLVESCSPKPNSPGPYTVTAKIEETTNSTENGKLKEFLAGLL